MSDQPAIVSPVDVVEARLVQLGAEIRKMPGDSISALPVVHHFTPGLYAREIFMPAGAILTSEIHKTEHPFVVSQGRCLVYLENENRWDVIQAPHFGVTQPGTRRLLIIVHDTVWTTFHATPHTSVEKIAEEILEHRENPLLVAPELSEEAA